MNDVTKTVMIDTDNGPVRINESDFNEKEHKLHKPNKAEQKEMEKEPVQVGATIPQFPEGMTAVPTPSTPQPFNPIAGQIVNPPAGNLMVMKEGKGKNERHYVVDQSGNRVERDGLDAAGYATETDAWTAVLALPTPGEVLHAPAGTTAAPVVPTTGS